MIRIDARPLLIALALVTFVGPASAQSGGAGDLVRGWSADVRTGCEVWRLAHPKTETLTWPGACVNGRAEGQGVVQIVEGGKPLGRYEGELRGGHFTRGTMTWPGGARYEGEWKDGLQQGRGKETRAGGGSYEGEWSKGQYEGQGTLVLVSGSRYVGRFASNWPSGPGALTAADGRVFSGTWANGCLRWGTEWVMVGHADKARCAR